LRFGYADPPYPGCAHLYRDHPDYAGEVDHAELVARLVAEYPDGWVLHTSSVALRDVLNLCPLDVRVMAWVKPFASFKPGVPVAYAWEPVIVRGGRPRTRQQDTVRDFMAENIMVKAGLTGAKPEPVCRWLFAVLNAQPGDTLDDLFPGTGGVTRAWWRFLSQLRQPAVATHDQPALLEALA
jgi:hypothetical protein